MNNSTVEAADILYGLADADPSLPQRRIQQSEDCKRTHVRA
jgi:hypothetical protein